MLYLAIAGLTGVLSVCHIFAEPEELPGLRLLVLANPAYDIRHFTDLFELGSIGRCLKESGVILLSV